MEHPFINGQDLESRTIEELEKSVSELNKKLRWAQASRNSALASQIAMALESYRTVLDRKIQQRYNQSSGNNNPYVTQVDIG